MTDENSTLSRLRRRIDERAERVPAWMPQPGDELAGYFIRWDQGTTARGETHRIAIVEEVGNEQRYAIWLFHTLLRQEFERIVPAAGELLVIRRGDDRVNAEGQPYRVYHVEVDREPEFVEEAPPVDVPEFEPEGDWALASPGDAPGEEGAF